MQILTRKGNAILTALFIITLVAITTTAIMRHIQTHIARTGQFIRTHELYLAAQLVPFWAMSTLKTHKSLPTTPNQAGIVLKLPKNLQKLYPGVQVTGSLYDLQSKFNLNNLTNAKMQPVFFKLVHDENPALTSTFIQSLISAIYQWITPISAKGSDKWAQYYQSLKHPYLPAHQPMLSVLELKMVAGVSQNLFHQLFPYITTLPEKTPINFNTAPKQLLQALSQAEDKKDELNSIISMRKEKGMLSEQEFNDAIATLKIDTSTVTIESTYFLSIAKVSKGRNHLTLYSILKRTPRKKATNDQNSPWHVSLVKQSINTL